MYRAYCAVGILLHRRDITSCLKQDSSILTRVTSKFCLTGGVGHLPSLRTINAIDTLSSDNATSDWNNDLILLAAVWTTDESVLVFWKNKLNKIKNDADDRAVVFRRSLLCIPTICFIQKRRFFSSVLSRRLWSNQWRIIHFCQVLMCLYLLRLAYYTVVGCFFSVCLSVFLSSSFSFSVVVLVLLLIFFLDFFSTSFWTVLCVIFLPVLV